MGLSTATISTDFARRGAVGGLDQGFKVDGTNNTGLGFGGAPIMVSRHVGSGHWMGLRKDSFKLKKQQLEIKQ